MRGVKALLTSFRRRVWSGASIRSIVLGRSMPSPNSMNGICMRRLSGSELIVGSRRIRSQSAHRVNTYSSHSGTGMIGVAARIRW